MTTRDVRAAMAARLREHYNGSANYEYAHAPAP